MKGKITKLFRSEGILDIDDTIEIGEKGKIIDPNGNGYTHISSFGKIVKVELVGTLESSQPRNHDADDMPNTSFMKHTAEGANALLRGDNGSVVEALFQCIQ